MVTLVLPPTRGALAEVLIPVNGLAGKHGCRSERAALPQPNTHVTSPMTGFSLTTPVIASSFPPVTGHLVWKG